jgi:hypothetical protein
MKFENYMPGNGYQYRLGVTDIDDPMSIYNDEQMVVWLNPPGKGGFLAANIGSHKWVNSDVLEQQFNGRAGNHIVAIQAWLKTKGVGGHKI